MLDLEAKGLHAALQGAKPVGQTTGLLTPVGLPVRDRGFALGVRCSEAGGGDGRGPGLTPSRGDAIQVLVGVGRRRLARLGEGGRADEAADDDDIDDPHDDNSLAGESNAESWGGEEREAKRNVPLASAVVKVFLLIESGVSSMGASTSRETRLETDYLVLGSGIAGLRAAIELARHGHVLVVTKDQPTESNTGYAQGGVAVAMAPDDDVALHLEDTQRAGAGIVSAPAARVLVEEGPIRIRELASWGARFDREGGRFHFTREGAHSRPRVLHALGDATGWEMARSLLEKAQRTAEIEVRSFACSTDLVTQEGRVVGCRFLDEDEGETTVVARATLLATGGAGQVFAETTNPPVATGDGVAMGLRAGAALLDMEFVQFHPTALAIPGAPRFLVSEAVRGEGARLLNASLERFTDELLSRDQVARAIFREERAGRGPVVLDLRHLDPDRVRTRFPRIHATCLRFGVDITRDPVPVTPAAHYVMGGVATDLDGRTTLPGLYAAGETAGTGVHGANRLASNSLLEGLVFGARAAAAMASDVNPAPGLAAPDATDTGEPGRENLGREALRATTWRCLGLERDAGGLAEMLTFLEVARGRVSSRPRSRTSAEDRNLADVAWAMARAASFRKESRGSHFRTDFPALNDALFDGHSWLDRSGLRLTEIDEPMRAGAPC
jgi:L-aspartate oxidase